MLQAWSSKMVLVKILLLWVHNQSEVNLQCLHGGGGKEDEGEMVNESSEK